MHTLEHITLGPPSSAVELRSYGFGWIPFDGKFTRFHGCMRYDPADADRTEVVLQIEAASLAMLNEPIRAMIVSSGMMDVARFPKLGFHGRCRGDRVVGDLTLRGETHGVTLDYARLAGGIVATGRVRQADWGVSGGQLIGGSTIRIRVTLPNPFDARAA